MFSSCAGGASSDRPAPAPKPGVAFPAGADGRVSTTATAKQIWSAAASAGGGDSAAGLALADAIRRERDWRHNYPAHLVALESQGFASCDASIAAATSGLAEVRKQFTFRAADGKTVPLAEMALPVAADSAARRRLRTGTVAGTAPPQPLQIPARGDGLASSLTEGNGAHTLISLGLAGTCEPSVGASAVQLLGDPGAGNVGELAQH
eukprot:SAG22_NODE_5650_length_978_cov_0.800910_1_plen_206_part_01